MSTEIIPKTPNEIRLAAIESLSSGQTLLNKSYFSQLAQFKPLVVSEEGKDDLFYALDLRLYKVARIVQENKQSTLESLTAAYTALGSAGYSVFLLLKSDGEKTDLYLGVRGSPKKNEGAEAEKLLNQVIKGHFSGSQLNVLKSSQTESLMFSLSHTSQYLSPSITAVTGIPSIAVEEREHFMQGLEKFIDAAEDNAYCALILAEPIGSNQLNLIQRGYENVATQLSPLLKQSLAFGENDSESVGLTIGTSITHSFGESISLTETKGTTEGWSKGSSYSKTTESDATKGFAIGSALLSVVGGGIAAKALEKGAKTAQKLVPILGGLGLAANMLGAAFKETENYGENSAYNKGTQHNIAKGKAQNTQDMEGKNESESVTQTQGSSRQITLEMIDKSVEQLLKQVDHHLERLAEARRFGAWHTAAYFFGESSASSRALGSIFLGLMRGNDSNSEDFALSTWNQEESKKLMPWLTNLTHPRLESDFAKNLGVSYLTPASLVSGKEMAIQLGLPRRSTSTVSVVETEAFGRQIQSVNGAFEQAVKTVHLGNIRHLWQETKQSVDLDVQKLSGHIFVTGSTGSGKSNTVYQLLNELNNNDVRFMVIEPAKGEYKNVFGHRDDVQVYGTNPKKTALLRINPFKFPEDVHVLEHIDRLVEIFNVCWPMEAAMPAILKNAMLKTYEVSGWNLATSEKRFPNLFPTFSDLLEQLTAVIEKSEYSAEIKSNYKGALLTRVESLTNGLNGQIFAANEIDNAILFDSNVIVDLSRVGSQETKSLMMGILVMRLSEHRMSNAEMNSPLKHVTVLEEAHNILKRTSTEQRADSSNVAGKAVEMLSNAIAEMRTYGEGFIIADQSPSAVDISAIRNTNTKIIMRLPDEDDRRLAGKAAGVNDDQLEEIAKLPKGVAVVYQNDWLEPVLCQVKYFDAKEKPFLAPEMPAKNQFNQHLAELLFSQKLPNKRTDWGEVLQTVEKSSLSANRKARLSKAIEMLEAGKIPLFLNQEHERLVDLYNRFIQQEYKVVLPDLSPELQTYFEEKVC